MTERPSKAPLVMPAIAGIQGTAGTASRVVHPFDPAMDPRFRGGDEGNVGVTEETRERPKKF